MNVHLNVQSACTLKRVFFFYYNTCFTGLLSSGSHNFIFYMIVFINNHIPPNSTLILFHYFYLIFLFAQLLTWPCILPFSTSLVHPGRLASSSRGNNPSIDHRLASSITIPPTVSLTGGAPSIVNMAHDVKVADNEGMKLRWSSSSSSSPACCQHTAMWGSWHVGKWDTSSYKRENYTRQRGLWKQPYFSSRSVILPWETKLPPLLTPNTGASRTF